MASPGHSGLGNIFCNLTMPQAFNIYRGRIIYSTIFHTTQHQHRQHNLKFEPRKDSSYLAFAVELYVVWIFWVLRRQVIARYRECVVLDIFFYVFQWDDAGCRDTTHCQHLHPGMWILNISKSSGRRFPSLITDMTWKPSPHHWPFVRGMHRSPMYFLEMDQLCGPLFSLGLGKMLNKEPSCIWDALRSRKVTESMFWGFLMSLWVRFRKACSIAGSYQGLITWWSFSAFVIITHSSTCR